MKTNLLLLLLGVLLLAVLNWQVPLLRFTNHWANEGVAVLVTALPLLLVAGLIRRIAKGPTRGVSRSLTAVLVVLAVPFTVLLAFKFLVLAFDFMSTPSPATAPDGGFAKVAQLDEHLAVYRTNGGATTAYGIVVRQERPLVPGVLLVKNIFSQYRLDSVACQQTGLRLTIRHPFSGQVLKAVTLKRFLYF